ncbi:ATP-dependent endonuclease [Actinoplanes sp. NPDC049265]|uniref:ATP-dependent nuclease n=1 Tax=Actinoplanes sp. NPDC049265 TaxID=3363902 RepID=UPI00371C2EDA
MLDIDIAVRNFRCFGDDPVKFSIRDGFTALVGTNNSGKSSLLRLIYELRPFFSVFNKNTPIGEASQMLLHAKPWNVNSFGVLPGERPWRAGENRDIEISFTVNDGPAGAFADHGEVLTYQFDFQKGGRVTPRILSGNQVLYGPGSGMQPDVRESIFNPFIFAMNVLEDTMYVGPFRNAINIGTQANYFDIQIGSAFVERFAEYKSGYDPDSNEAVAILLDEIRRIFGFQALDINPNPEMNALQLTVDGRSFRLTEQGAGIAHFIVVLVNLLVRRPSILLIDEPELNLHSSLQLDFLTTLAKYVGTATIYATHSMGLARTSADQIFVVSKTDAGRRKVAPYEGADSLVTLMGQLSFEGSPQLGFSKILLVEGKTEIRAMMQLLRSFGKEHEVLCLPLHGGEMIRGDVEQELLDILRISKSVSYLIDSERKSPSAALSRQRQDFTSLCARLGIAGHVLERRALENYFSQTAIDRTFGRKFEALGPFDKKGVSQGWAKTENWRIAANVSREEMLQSDLGGFLEAL